MSTQILLKLFGGADIDKQNITKTKKYIFIGIFIILLITICTIIIIFTKKSSNKPKTLDDAKELAATNAELLTKAKLDELNHIDTLAKSDANAIIKPFAEAKPEAEAEAEAESYKIVLRPN